jgi:hypothetical protein
MEWIDYIEDAYINRKEVIFGEAAICCGTISLPPGKKCTVAYITFSHQGKYQLV